MKQVFRFDSSGVYKEPVILDDNVPIPQDCTEIQPPDGLFKAVFNNGAWVEGMSSADIDNLKSAKEPPTDFEEVKKNQTDLIFTLMSKGVL